MRSQQHFYPWPIQILIESAPGSLIAEYRQARSSQNSINLYLQRRRIVDCSVSKWWKLAQWHELPGEYEDMKQHSFIAQMLSYANSQFWIAFCPACRYRTRNVGLTACRELRNLRTGLKEGS